MAFQRGDVVLIPFPFSDLTATKTRPAVVVSSAAYQSVRSELLLAYVSSQIGKATAPIDYVLNDWQAAGLLKPSFVRPKIAAIEPALIVHQVGRLSLRDQSEVDRRLRRAMDLTSSALPDVAQEIDLAQQSPAIVQVVAEKAVAALVTFSKTNNPPVDLLRIRKLL
ncbi:MAG: type II toxin-antitoxin system PemK/MazF family toxin [Caldilineaceae bacterium]